MNRILVALGLVLAVSPDAFAQAPSKGFITVNGGYQLTKNNFGDGAAKRENAEDGRFDTTYVVKGGPAFDVAGGATLWRHLGIGVGISRFTVATPSALKATIPHPFFFNQPRSVSGDVTGLKREELAVHVQARGILPAGTRLQVMVFGGPSWFQVKQGIVTDYTYSESYPYDSATFRQAVTSAPSVSKLGFNGGGDVAFFFTRQVGVGATVQFAGTTVQVTAAGGTKRDIKVGGGSAGGGLRLRF